MNGGNEMNACQESAKSILSGKQVILIGHHFCSLSVARVEDRFPQVLTRENSAGL